MIVEEGVELGDVGVIEKTLNFNLSDELGDVSHIVFKYAFLNFF